jgi:hypothetical protein
MSGIVAMTEAVVRVATATTGIKASVEAVAGIEAAAGMEAVTGVEATAEIEAARLPAVAVVPLTVASTPKVKMSMIGINARQNLNRLTARIIWYEVKATRSRLPLIPV